MLSIVPLHGTLLRRSAMCVRTFSITKIFDVTLRRGYAESSNTGGDDSFQDIDACSSTAAYSTGNLSHNSLSPPPEVSPYIFRKFSQADEPLGPGADKCGEYKNAEYYGYHIFSYADILMDIIKIQELREKIGAEPSALKIEDEASFELETTKEAAASESINEADAADQPKVRMVCSVGDDSEEKLAKSEDVLACEDYDEVPDAKKDCQPKDEEKDEAIDQFCEICNECALKDKPDKDDEC